MGPILLHDAAGSTMEIHRDRRTIETKVEHKLSVCELMMTNAQVLNGDSVSHPSSSRRSSATLDGTCEYLEMTRQPSNGGFGTVADRILIFGPERHL